MSGLLLVAAIVVVFPFAVWHYAGYFNGRYDR